MINGEDWEKVWGTLGTLQNLDQQFPKETSQLQVESSDKQKVILSPFNNIIWVCIASLQELSASKWDDNPKKV